jgi:glycolate oxidase iron-sulfur subunit
MAASSIVTIAPDTHHGPAQADLDKCVHCGLCLNACPTYRELGLEMDSPRGRIYQMNAVANGAPITRSYIEHLGLCLACRGCETACPSGVPYGRMIEAARADIEARTHSSLWSRALKHLAFNHLLPSRNALRVAGIALYAYQASGIQQLARASGLLRLFGKLAEIDALAPHAELPFFFRHIGQTFPALGERRFRVAFLAGCIANVAFAQLNEATVRVLQRNGCEVVIPARQNCCGALHLHSGRREKARTLARNNIDAVPTGGFDAILTNAAGCGSTLKEYADLLADDASYCESAVQFAGKMQDVTEFLASIDLNGDMGPVDGIVTYQDSCHLAHGQRVKDAPRKLLKAIPGLRFREMPMADLCCGSAGIYNVVHTEMSMQILRHKMEHIAGTKASVIATANPGCMLQLATGARLYGSGQRVVHVIELLDEAYESCPSRLNPAAEF